MSFPRESKIHSNGQITNGLPWVERFRPVCLEDVVGNDEGLKRLRLIGQHGNMPNMLLCGPPGTGKTTSVLCLARTLLRPHASDPSSVILELNASDARGIDIVRGKIKLFAQTKVNLPAGLTKIVILDEADAMTLGAQQGLRRLMDRYAATTRFALACNSVSKIIDVVQSRCIVIRFPKIPDDVIIKRLKQIASTVNEPEATFGNTVNTVNTVGKCTDQGFKALAFTAQGDLRLAINNFQAVVSRTERGDVTPENVYKIADQPHPTAVASILTACARGPAGCITACSEMQLLWRMGYAPIDIVTTMLRLCPTLPALAADQAKQIRFTDEIGRAHVRVSDGLSSLLQLNGLVARLSAPK
jgi:replication factor C subunit 2/4